MQELLRFQRSPSVGKIGNMAFESKKKLPEVNESQGGGGLRATIPGANVLLKAADKDIHVPSSRYVDLA